MSYGGEAVLGLGSPIVQYGYLKALGAMTEFKAKYSKPQYTLSDKPDEMAQFRPELHERFKQLEARRKFWNKMADFASLFSAGRNAAVAAGFFAMGLPVLAIPTAMNAAASAGWVLAQRTPSKPRFINKAMIDHPSIKQTLRWSSIVVGLAAPMFVLVMKQFMAEELADKQGEQGASVLEMGEDSIQELGQLFDSLLEDPILKLFEDDDNRTDFPEVTSNPLPVMPT
jgi:hypothetical protein